MKYYVILCVSLLLLSCGKQGHSDLKYTANADALKFYHQGWEQIMDEGRYGEAEISYRKVLEHDPDFLIGKSVLARLTLDLEERLLFYNELHAKKDGIHGDERLVLDVYIALVNFTNLRDQGSSETKDALQNALKLAEKNLKKIVHSHPEEVYLKAEYIEVLNSIYGPRQAIDSLQGLTTIAQKENPFLLGFQASMYAELGEYELAMQKANHLLEVVNDSTLPKTYAVLADVYFKMGNLKIAKSNADRATELDARNLDASRLKTKIDMAIQEQSSVK